MLLKWRGKHASMVRDSCLSKYDVMTLLYDSNSILKLEFSYFYPIFHTHMVILKINATWHTPKMTYPFE